MNQMVIKGVNSQTFMAANLGRVEKFYRDFLDLPVVKRTVHHLNQHLPVITFGFRSFTGEPRRGHTISYVEWNPIFYMMSERGFTEHDTTALGVASPRVGVPKDDGALGPIIISHCTFSIGTACLSGSDVSRISAFM